jgi:hypothetical protein
MIIRVKQWYIVEQAPELGQEPRFSVVVTDDIISTHPLLYQLPYTGITDTSITPDTHDLYIERSDDVQHQGSKSAKDHIFFRRKTLTEEGGTPSVSSFGNLPVSSVFADTVSATRKAIVDDNSGVAITVSDKTTATGTPGREMLVGEKGITMLSGSPTILSLPEEDLVLFKQKGIGQLAPQCFVPPFCFPEYMPNMEFVGQVSKVVEIMKAIRAIASAG